MTVVIAAFYGLIKGEFAKTIFQVQPASQLLSFYKVTRFRAKAMLGLGSQNVVFGYFACPPLMKFYYMASLRAGMMNQILRCDWLPERPRWSYLARQGLPAVSLKKHFPESHKKSFIDQVCLVKMVGYWPDSCFASLLTSTPSRSINKQKKEFGQYPAILTEKAWSITHIQHCI